MTSVKKKRVSKKNKISWRKYVDIKDVEEFLEDKRLEERLGEKLETVPDKDLFQVDTKPKDKSRLDKKQRRLLTLQVPPKCFSLLQPLTKTPDPLVKRNRVKTKEEKKHPIARRNEEKRLKNGIVKAKERVRALNREHEKKRKLANKRTFGQVDNNIWQVEDLNSVDVEDKQWLSADTVRHTCTGLGKLRKAIPRSLNRKPNAITAVPLPHPGTSYNPSLADHQQLLNEVAQDELKKIKEQKHLERVTTRMFSKVAPEQKEKSWLSEMSEGLSKEPQKENKPEENDKKEYKAINPPVQNLKKDRKQRRIQKEQKQQEKARREAKIEKKKLSDMYRLKKFENQITQKENTSVIRAARRKEKRKKRELEPRQLSRHKVEVSQPDFQLPEEMSGSLRKLKVIGNTLKDRFRNLQHRSVVAGSVARPGRPRAKVKKFERASHKMGWESKGY